MVRTTKAYSPRPAAGKKNDPVQQLGGREAGSRLVAKPGNPGVYGKLPGGGLAIEIDRHQQPVIVVLDEDKPARDQDRLRYSAPC
jgi:hypothetical protein